MATSPPAREIDALATLAACGRGGASLFAMACAERLRPLLQRVPSGSPPLVAGIALTALWRVLEGLDRPDPRRLVELSQACWTLVEIEPVPGVPTALLEQLIAAAHHALETYRAGDPKQALLAASKACEAAGPSAPAELLRQDRDLEEIAVQMRAGGPLAPFATSVRKRAEKEGKHFVATLLTARS